MTFLNLLEIINIRKSVCNPNQTACRHSLYVYYIAAYVLPREPARPSSVVERLDALDPQSRALAGIRWRNDGDRHITDVLSVHKNGRRRHGGVGRAPTWGVG